MHGGGGGVCDIRIKVFGLAGSNFRTQKVAIDLDADVLLCMEW